MALSQTTGEALVAGVLAVNRYPLEKSYALLPRLRQSGLTDAKKVETQDLETLTVALGRAGFSRGMLTGMMAERLHDAMKAVTEGRLDALDRLVAAGKREDFVASLCSVRGIGPHVAGNVWALLRG